MASNYFEIEMMFLVFYALYLIIYISFLIQQAIKFKKDNGYLCEASGLGSQENELNKYYNVGYFFFGFFSIIFTSFLWSHLNSGFLTTLGISFMYLADVSLCLIALSPRDTKPKPHTIFSITLFIGTIFSQILLISPFKEIGMPQYIILLNYIIPLSLLYYIALKIKYIRKLGFDNKQERIVSIYEWIPFLLTFLWSILVAINILLK